MEKIFKFPEVRQEEERGVATSIQKDQRPVGSRLRFPLDELYNCTSVDFSVCEMHFFFLSAKWACKDSPQSTVFRMV